MPDKAADEKDSAGEARNGVDGVVKPPAANGLGGDLNSRYDVGKKVHSPALSPGRVPPFSLLSAVRYKTNGCGRHLVQPCCGRT